MATESTLLSNDPASAGRTEPSPATERALEAGAYDFEPHDTIPAPPWLGEDAEEPLKAP